MPDAVETERAFRDASDRNDYAVSCERTHEGESVLHLPCRRRTVRPRRARVRRHDVPEKHVVLDPELAQHPVHDRRGRLGRA